MAKDITLAELQSGLRIDRDDLDNEIATQADTYYRVAEASALAVSRRDEAKTQMEEELVRAALRVRSEGKDEKLTEAFIKEQSSRDRKYTDARSLYLKAKSEADLWGAMRDAYEMRAKMLKAEAELHIAGYYQTSAVSGRAQRQVGEIANEGNRAALRRASRERA